MSFQSLISSSALLKAIQEMGYQVPTPIQQLAIPKVLEGSDLSGCAQTGTGKSASFLLPLLQKVSLPSEQPGTGPRVLILVPTRELALQLEEEAISYSKYLSKVKTISIFGGSPYPLQNRKLAKPHELLIATPGRLIDHMEKGRVNFSRLETFVLDEADRMLDMGFIHAVHQIAESLPKDRQTLLFSATLKASVLKLCAKLLKNPIEITVQSPQDTHENIDQKLFFVDDIQHKYRLLDHLLSDEQMEQAIIFTSTKRQADALAERLQDNNLLAKALHGDMHQRARSKTIAQMHEKSIRFLVATDVAARGIDVARLTHVINFDLPMTAEDYVHRIGRTGRAGAKGQALSFVSSFDKHMLKEIEKLTGKKIIPTALAGFEAKTHRDNPKNKPLLASKTQNGKPKNKPFKTAPYPQKKKRNAFFKKSKKPILSYRK